jgi:hypothetical protein
MATKTVDAKDALSYDLDEHVTVGTKRSSDSYDRGSDIARAVLKGLKQKQIDDEKRALYQFLALVASAVIGFGVFGLFLKSAQELHFIIDILIGAVVGIAIFVIVSIRITDWYYSE